MKIIIFIIIYLSTYVTGFASPYDDLTAKIAGASEIKPLRIRIIGITGKGPGSAKWSGSLGLVSAKLKEALDKNKDLSVTDQENLKVMEEEAAISGKNVKLQDADYSLEIFARQLERELTLEVRMVKFKDGTDETFTLSVDPKSIGIDIEADLPPADAAIKICNSNMFKIARNMLQRKKMNLALNDLTNDPEDLEFAESVKERISVIEKEISNWSKEVSKEILELVELDEDIVAEALQDRIDVLRVEGKLQEIDTKSQQKLIHSLELLWKRAKDTGLEPNQLSIEKECKVFIDSDANQ